METYTLKKTLLYSGVAIVLGLLLTLVPLITLAEFRPENHYDTTAHIQSFSGQMKRLEGTYGLDKPAYTGVDLQVLGVCFTVALVIYLFFKRRIPLHDYRRPLA
jgi:hypothetical protein